MPRISIVIPSSSNSIGLSKCLASLVKYTDLESVEILVVANGASEETRTICHQFPVMLVWEPEAQGYTKATNLGISKASGDYILLLNDDCEILDSPKNQWIETLIAPLADRVAMSGVHEIWSEEIRHNFIPFYCAMIRRDVLDHIGLLDEVFSPGHSEDIDFCARMLRAGYNYVNVDPHAKQDGSLMVGSFPLYHAGSQTFHQTPERRAAYEIVVQRNLATLRERYSRLRLLVVLVNYGTENLHYLRQVINRYRSFSNYEVSIVVHSNVPIEGVETVLHTSPPNGSWLNLPWECRKTIYEHRDTYDLYLYSENDHLISERNINAFVAIDLPDNLIAGFMRYENSPNGRFYPDYHKHFDWDLSSVRQIGNYTVAKFGNLHQGSFLVTRKQLARAVESPAFLDPNQRQWDSEYDILARCSTDLYDTGFEKVIPISHFEDFLIHHLPDKYYGVYGTKCDDEMQSMIGQMLEKPRYSIVIPTFRHLDCLIRCCETLRQYTDLSNVECLIVANGCGDDGTKAYVESLGHPFKLIWFDEAQGFTRATNAGIREARGTHIVFMNNDVYLIEQTLNGWLDKLQELWDSVPNAGVVGALVENVFIGKKFVAFYLAMTSRKVIDHIGVLDESVFSSGGEDVDFCIRAQNAGYEIIGNQTVYDEQGNKRFAVDFPFHHLGETTVSENPNFMEDWKKSNAILTSRYGTKYSIVIPTFNHVDDLLRPCIESIIQHTDLSRVECLIVANGCTDSTREYVESLGAPFKLIWFDEKVGFIKATNAGIEAAEGEYIIFLNNDVVLQGEWIPILEKAFIDHPDCGASGPLKFIGEKGKSSDFLMMFCSMVSRAAADTIAIYEAV